MEALWQEIRHALRSLYRNAGLSAAAIATLAVGLGMNVGVFSLVNTVLLRPFAFPEQDRLVILWEQDLTRDQHLHEVSFPNFQDWKTQSSLFDDMAAMGSTFWGRLRFVGEGEFLFGINRAVSHSFFATLGVEAAHGRTFLPEDDLPGAPPVVVVSHRFW